MSTIIMVEHDEGATIGFDAAITHGNSQYEVVGQKVVVNGELILGCAGDVRRQNALEHADLPQPYDWDIDRYVALDLVPAIMAVIESRTFSTDQPEGEILAVVRGRVYEIGNDGSIVRRTDRRHSVGTGSHFALGAMKAGGSVREALEAAAYFDAFTGHGLTVVQSAELLEGIAA